MRPRWRSGGKTRSAASGPRGAPTMPARMAAPRIATTRKPPWYRNEDWPGTFRKHQTNPAAPADTENGETGTVQKLAGRERVERQVEREQRADQQRQGAGVGAVVDARQVAAGHGHDDQRQRGRRGADEADDAQHPAAGGGGATAHHRPDDQRPEQVELLLHRERPHVQQGRRRGERDRSSSVRRTRSASWRSRTASRLRPAGGRAARSRWR